MSSTALIILNYNNANDTLNCVESILKHNTAPVKWVVVDNASRADELKALKEVMSKCFGSYAYVEADDNPRPQSAPQATLIETGTNAGYARGNNVGLRYVEADEDIDKVMILNNDVLFVEDIIPEMTKILDEKADCAMLSPVLYKKGMEDFDINCARLCPHVSDLIKVNFLHYVYRARKMEYGQANPHLFLSDKLRMSSGLVEIELPSGSCMLLKKSTFKDMGYFDPHTFMYFEENILYKKAKSLGKRSYLSLDHKCIHLGASTVGKTPGNIKLIRAGKDSEKYYVKQYSGASLPARWLHTISVGFYMTMYRIQKSIYKKWSKA